VLHYPVLGKSYVILLLFYLAKRVLKILQLFYILDVHHLFNQKVKFKYSLLYGYEPVRHILVIDHMFILNLIITRETLRAYHHCINFKNNCCIIYKMGKVSNSIKNNNHCINVFYMFRTKQTH
jgi:hypothetical protein